MCAQAGPEDAAGVAVAELRNARLTEALRRRR